MTINPTGTSAFYARARSDMTALRKQAEMTQGQLSSGERLEKSSDDPVAASRLRTLARADRLAEVDVSNTNRAAGDLALVDSTLTSIADLVTRVRDLAVQAGSETLNDKQRAAIGIEVGEIHTQLVALANARDVGGHALFGGATTGDAYGIDGTGQAVYQGTGNAGEIELGEGQTVIRSLTGPEIFTADLNGSPVNLLGIVKDLSLALAGGVADPAQAARDALSGLTAGVENIATNQTVVGARLVWLDFVAARQTDLGEMRSAEKADKGGVDIAEAMIRLQETMTILQASQAGFARLSGLTLFDHIR